MLVSTTSPFMGVTDFQSQFFTSTSTAPGISNAVSMWLPLVVVITFAMVIILLIIIGRTSCCYCCSSDSTQRPRNVFENNGASINQAFSVGIDGITAPPTPPPSYNTLARQISYVSSISQTSSQIEIPPAYDEAVDIIEFTADAPSALQPPYGSKLDIPHRMRIFPRSVSIEAPTSRSLFSQLRRGSISSPRLTSITNLQESLYPAVEHQGTTDDLSSSNNSAVVANVVRSELVIPAANESSVESSSTSGVTLSTSCEEESDSGVIMMYPL